MAEEQVSNDAPEPVQSSGGLISGIVAAVAEGLGNAWDTITGSPAINAFARQGADELGAALKAFPDSIQQDEVGVLWNPPVSEIAADREASDIGRSPWPSEIANQNRYQPSNGNENDAGKDTGHSM